jgi:hypothetical protein
MIFSKEKAVVMAISLIVMIGTTSIGFSQIKKPDTKTTIKSGSHHVQQPGSPAVKSKPGLPEKKLYYDLSIGRIHLDNKCQVIVELQNTGKDTIPKSDLSKVDVSADFGKQRIRKGINQVDRKMKLGNPGEKISWNTGITAIATGSFSASIDRRHVIKETNEINNKNSVILRTRCKSKTGQEEKTTLPKNGFSMNQSGIPTPQVPENIETRSLERGLRIISPTAGQQFFSGSTVNIKFALQDQPERRSIERIQVTGVYLYLDGTKVASLTSSSELPVVRAGKNSIGIVIPMAAITADGYTATITAQLPSGEIISGISDRFSVRRRTFESPGISQGPTYEQRTASASVGTRMLDKTRDEGITVTSPAPGQRYMPGQNIPVRFSISTTFDHPSPDTRPTSFRVLLIDGSGTSVNLYEGSETDLDLPVPEDASGSDYKILILGMEDPSWYGVAGMFSIGLSQPGLSSEGIPSAEVAPFLRITDPPDIVSWNAGCTRHITLRTNVHLTDVNLKLLTGRDANIVLYSDTYSAGSAVAVDGQNQYTIFYSIPSDAGDNGRLGHYRLGVEQIGGEELEAISDSIWLHRSEYQVLRPVSGTYFWENLTVSWSIRGCAAVNYDIQLVRQPPGDSVTTDIATGLRASYTPVEGDASGRFTQTFHWPIPDDFERGTYKVKLTVYERGLSETQVYESNAFHIGER